MNGIVLFAMAALGVDYGWQPTPDGNLEYIIQIEPELLASMEEGTPITSEIVTPPDAGRITCFRVKVGSGQVPREAPVQPVGYQDGQANPQVDQYGRPILRRPAQWIGDPQQYNQLANQHGYTAQPPNDAALADRPQVWSNPSHTPSNTGGTLLAAPTDAPRTTLDTTTPSYRRPYADTSHDRDYVTTPRRQVGFGDDPAADRYATLPPKSGTLLRTANSGENRVYGSYRTEAEKPWWPLFFTTTALFLSIGGNAYLAWMAAEFYSRYRDTIDRLRAVERRS